MTEMEGRLQSIAQALPGHAATPLRLRCNTPLLQYSLPL
jgi:hypothetical protein